MIRAFAFALSGRILRTDSASAVPFRARPSLEEGAALDMCTTASVLARKTVASFPFATKRASGAVCPTLGSKRRLNFGDAGGNDERTRNRVVVDNMRTKTKRV